MKNRQPQHNKYPGRYQALRDQDWWLTRDKQTGNCLKTQTEECPCTDELAAKSGRDFNKNKKTKKQSTINSKSFCNGNWGRESPKLPRGGRKDNLHGALQLATCWASVHTDLCPLHNLAASGLWCQKRTVEHEGGLVWWITFSLTSRGQLGACLLPGKETTP